MTKYTEACAAILDNYNPSGDAAQNLLDSVVAELPRAFDYDSKLQKAISLMWRVRNQSPSFVPINILRPEVMSRIFWFGRHCCLPKSQLTRRNAPTDDNLIYPETALEVCHRWREIALASPDLWSHIDIDLTSGSEGILFSRALAFAARSNRAPLDLHMRIDFYFREDERLSDFCHSIVPRTRSVDFQSDCRTPLPRDALPLLASLLSSDATRTLRRFCINAQPMREFCFLTPNDSTHFAENPRTPHSQPIPLNESIFENTMSLVTSMQLDGMYPSWSSRAYAGLVELDLDASQPAGIAISELALANILRASPALRTFCFGLNMTFESGHASVTPDPVQLGHLEMIKLTGHYTIAQEAVLRMIYPRQLPLQMIVEVIEHYRFASPTSYWVQFINFVSRSRIAQLHIKGVAEVKILLEASQLFSSLPQLQVLTLCEVILGQACEEILGDYDATSFLLLLHGYNHGDLGLNLQLVRLMKCKIYWNDFRYISEIHPTQTLELEQCQLVTIPPKDRHGFFFHRRDVRSLLIDGVKKLCPRVELKSTFVDFEEVRKFKVETPKPRDDTQYPTTFGDGPNPNSAFGLFGGPTFGS
ncbi:unnamed protein product [Rhizoctonia solani]|uniref:F-box domain-containing protein n=1 Tax=Rhizoctonia solani TaxID=456999 RepID=A0A8H2W7M5_9AGAM|nr:unnamed protein product [Rhizoctonia solani]